MELPKGFNTKWFNCRKPFVDFFATREELIFGKAVIPNPLFEANLYTQWDLKRAVAQHPNRSLDDHFKSQQQSYATRLGTYTSTRGKLLPLDVFTLTHQLQTNPKIETLKLLQVAQLCGRMRDVFGLRARFVADRSDDQLVLLLLAADKLTRKFNKRFVIDPPNATLRSISQALKEALANVGVQELFWETCMTDTNVCDATRNPTPLPIDASATGDIYRPDAVVHVHLNGVQAVKSKPFVRVTVKDVDGLQTTFDVTNEQATNHFGKDYLRGMIASTNVPVPLSSSVRKPTLEQHIVSFSHTLKYALKRAGDWGQVAHCARYDKVFVTSDILAAMYAHYRGVRYMLLRRQENLNEEYPTLPTFIRYTFVLHG